MTKNPSPIWIRLLVFVCIVGAFWWRYPLAFFTVLATLKTVAIFSIVVGLVVTLAIWLITGRNMWRP